MNKEDKIKIIERYDTYFSEINNKGAFLLAFNTLIISGFLIGIKDLKEIVCYCNIYKFNVLTFTIVFLSIVSTAVTIISIIPYLGSTKSSFWFFGDVSKKTYIEFMNEIDNQEANAQKRDLNEQIYFLALGLSKKHKWIRVALILNLIQIPLLIFLTLILL